MLISSFCFFLFGDYDKHTHAVALLSVVSAQTFFNQNRRIRSSRNFRRFLDDDVTDTASDAALPAAGGSYSSQTSEGGDSAAQTQDAGNVSCTINLKTSY